tara:strand:+ start:99005 stop:99214 length:210 start_codon:yes stop_codon:yes gene_type:complete
MNTRETELKPGKVRHCWNCGADMGFIENRFYDRMDTCGSRECERAARDAFEEDREEAHRAVDDYYGGGW